MKPVSVAALNSREEAESLCAGLRAAGIRAEIRSDAAPGSPVSVSRPSAGVSVEVPRAEFEAALRLIYEWDAAEAGGIQGPMDWLGSAALSTQLATELRARHHT